MPEADPGPGPEFRPERILRVLSDEDVAYILIGGFAAVVHGSPYVTLDLDIVPERGAVNLARLSDALRVMHARVVAPSEPLELRFEHDASSLEQGEVWNLVTDHGRLDISFQPSGTQGFADLARDAESLTILGNRVVVASLADIVRSKEAAGRDKDRLALPTLRRLLEEAERRGSRA
jgi:hypothetical protein